MPSPITVSAIVRDSKKADGSYPVKIRIIYNRRKKELPTAIYAEPRQLTKDLHIKDPVLRDVADSLVSRMREAAAKIDPYSLEGMDVHGVATAIERILSGEGRSFSLDFPDYFEKIASEKPKASRSNYMSAIHALCSFFGSEHFDISKVSSSNMRRFERYLTEKHGSGARAVSLYTKTIAYVHRRAREEYNNEESDEVLIRNPFEYYHCPQQKPTKHRNVDESIFRAMLEQRGDLKGRERLGVDFFLISFALMGMNTPDIFSCLKPKDGIIIYQRAKTRDRRGDDAEMHVRIEPCVAPLLSQYKGFGRFAFNFHNRYADPTTLARAVNIGLEAFCKRIHVPKMTIYAARHSWASIAYSIGIDKYTINDCLCHVDPDMRVTDIYIKKDWRVLWEANAKVLALFDWPD